MMRVSDVCLSVILSFHQVHSTVLMLRFNKVTKTIGR